MAFSPGCSSYMSVTATTTTITTTSCRKYDDYFPPCTSQPLAYSPGHYDYVNDVAYFPSFDDYLFTGSTAYRPHCQDVLENSLWDDTYFSQLQEPFPPEDNLQDLPSISRTKNTFEGNGLPTLGERIDVCSRGVQTEDSSNYLLLPTDSLKETNRYGLVASPSFFPGSFGSKAIDICLRERDVRRNPPPLVVKVTTFWDSSVPELIEPSPAQPSQDHSLLLDHVSEKEFDYSSSKVTRSRSKRVSLFPPIFITRKLERFQPTDVDGSVLHAGVLFITNLTSSGRPYALGLIQFMATLMGGRHILLTELPFHRRIKVRMRLQAPFRFGVFVSGVLLKIWPAMISRCTLPNISSIDDRLLGRCPMRLCGYDYLRVNV